MAWDAAKVDAQINGSASPQNVVGTELFSDAVTLNPEETASVQVSTNSDGTTDSLEIKFYATLDDAGEVWDTVALNPVTLDATSGNTVVITTMMRGVKKFRVGVKRTGSTDTLATSIHYVKNQVDI